MKCRSPLSVLALMLLACTSLAQPPAAPVPRVTVDDPAAAISARFGPILEHLTPDKPEAYFLLGEEIADGPETTEHRKLAATLFVLAIELDRAKPKGGRVAASACIALADLTRDDAARRWLTALAESFDPTRTNPEWARSAPPETDDAEGFQVATFMGLVRSGDGNRARQLLNKPGVRSAFMRYDSLLSRLGAGTASGIIRESERWPCPECGNQRISKRLRADGDGRICFHCLANPGPKLSRDELLAQLRVESWILQGSQRSWAAQAVTDDGAPLYDPQPEGLGRVFGVDPRAVYWRNGRWCQTPDCSTPAQPAAPPDAKPQPPKPPPATGTSGS